MTTSLRTIKPRRWRRIIIAVIAAILLAWGGLLTRDALALRADWEMLQSDLAALSTSGLDLSQLQARVDSLRANLESLRSHAGPLLALTPTLGWLPDIGDDIGSAPALLDMGVELLTGGEIALRALAPLWPPQPVDGQSALQAVAHGLDAARADLAQVQAHIERAGSIRQQIDAAALPASARGLLEQFDATYPVLRGGVALLPIAPRLLGVDRPHTYLILVQNEDELRPAGGFISAVGRVTLDAGEIVTMTVVDAYQVDDFSKPYAAPPAPLLDYMGSELWLFRDSNWSPDFPTAARKAIELYAYADDRQIDGVIGLNQKVAEALVAGLGYVQVDPNEPPVTVENLRTYMRSAWAPPPGVEPSVWFSQRKDFIGRLSRAILEHMLNHADQINWLSVGRSLYGVLRSHDLMIYLSDGPGAKQLAGMGWDGALQSQPGDFLMVVDANLGFNKTNAIIQQALTYSVSLDGGKPPVAEVTVVYTHTGAPAEGCAHTVPNYTREAYTDLIQQCYWDYRRVLAPAGAQLIDATRQALGADKLITRHATDGSTQVSLDSGKTAFGALLLVERGQRVESWLRYRLPEGVVESAGAQRTYKLYIQRQSGSGPWPLTVNVAWPVGWRYVSATLAPVSATPTSATFQVALDADHELWVTLEATG